MHLAGKIEKPDLGSPNDIGDIDQTYLRAADFRRDVHEADLRAANALAIITDSRNLCAPDRAPGVVENAAHLNPCGVTCRYVDAAAYLDSHKTILTQVYGTGSLSPPDFTAGIVYGTGSLSPRNIPERQIDSAGGLRQTDVASDEIHGAGTLESPYVAADDIGSPRKLCAPNIAGNHVRKGSPFDAVDSPDIAPEQIQ